LLPSLIYHINDGFVKSKNAVIVHRSVWYT